MVVQAVIYNDILSLKMFAVVNREMVYAIKFANNSQVRYATETQGNPEYNAIDTGTLATAKVWKTKRGANNYLKFYVLVGRCGERIQKRWSSIEVVEIQQPAQSENILRCYTSKPVIAFCPTPNVLEWLERERLEDETDTELLNRKLRTLIAEKH